MNDSNHNRWKSPDSEGRLAGAQSAELCILKKHTYNGNNSTFTCPGNMDVPKNPPCALSSDSPVPHLPFDLCPKHRLASGIEHSRLCTREHARSGNPNNEKTSQCTPRPGSVGSGTRTTTADPGHLGRRVKRLFPGPNPEKFQEESRKGRRPGYGFVERVNGAHEPRMFPLIPFHR
jgi:hypothetical protein